MSKSRFSVLLGLLLAAASHASAQTLTQALTTGGCYILEGSGSPEGAVRGSVCDHYTNATDGTVWLKLSGSNTTTGWQQLPSNPVTAAQGGFGASTSAWSGIPSVNAGAWQQNNVLTADRVLVAGASNTVTSSGNFTYENAAARLNLIKDGLYSSEGAAGFSIKTAAASYRKILFGVDETNDVGFIQAMTFDNFATTPLSLQPNGGRVGIGVIAPSVLLDLSGAAAAARITSTDATGATLILNNTTGVGAGVWDLRSRTADGRIGFRRDSDNVKEYLSILPTGPVGIGTTTPAARLSINGGLHVGGDSDPGNDNALIDGTLAVTGISTLTGLANANGGIAVDTTAFTVADATGHVDTLGYVGSRGFVSQTTGWRCTFLGACDARYIFADELRIKLFSVEEQAVYRASLMVTKSHSEIAQAFTCPAAGGGATLVVRDAATLPDARVFAVGDWVVIRLYSRTDSDADGNQELVVGDCVGSVSSYADLSGATEGMQSWTFTRGSGGLAGSLSASTVIPVGNAVLDFGVAGNGAVELNAYDGAEGVNAPYIQTKRWATAPVAANFTVTSRLGKLTGITGTADEFGLIAGIYSATDGAYFRASNAAFDLHGITARWWDATTNVITIAPNSGAPYIGIGNPAPSTCCTTAGIFLGWTASNVAAFSAYADANNFLTYDGTKLTWKAANTTLDASGNLTATSATLSGAITATTGAIGGFNIGADYIRDQANSFGLSSTVTGGDDIRFFAGAGSPGTGAEFYVTESGTLFAVQGTIGGWALTGTSLTSGSGATTVGLDSGGSNPAIYAGSATPGSAPFRVTNAGAMTATSGVIGGFTIGATTLSATNLTLTSGAANTAHIAVGTGSNIAGLNSCNAGSDIGAWAGATHANRATAAFRVTCGGTLTATTVDITGGLTVSTNVNPGAGKIVKEASHGMLLRGVTGSLNDFAIARESGTNVISMPTSTDDIVFSSTTGVRMAAFSTGNAQFDADGNISSSSDARLKEHIEPYRAGLREVLQIEPVTFHWNAASGLERSHRYAGFVAQDVAAVLPFSFGIDPRGYLTLQDRAIVGALVNAVQEQQAEIDALRRELREARPR